ncbi:T9SS type B sorting domain-containing protein [Polaribacter sp.]|uniref:T9SS type B sorting domain-containing protein n=1 Tax=Polaribacter sp. TaxID=1920175 RepID=UPI003F6B07D9
MRCALIILFIIFTNFSFAQGETNFWYFGNKAALDFNLGDVQPLSNSNMETPFGSSSISDVNGNLLFYTNGETVWNRNHQIMENGTGLAGQPENTQPSIIIPKPGSNEIYYVFTTRKEATSNYTTGIRYSEIEISNRYPLGNVINKNVFLNIYKTERITAIHSNDGNSIWVITFGSRGNENGEPFDTFSTYKVNTTGVDNTRIQKTIPEAVTASSVGQLTISPNGKKIALSNFDFSRTAQQLKTSTKRKKRAQTNSKFKLSESQHILNFNNETGDISYDTSISTNVGIGVWFIPYGVAFSPDSTILYQSGDLNIGSSIVRQYNLEGNSDPLNAPVHLISSTDYNYRHLQIGSDGKIYVAKITADLNNIDSEFIDRINEPNLTGFDCDYQANSVNIQPGFSQNGMPNFIQSYFQSKIFSEDKCLDEVFNFSAQSYIPIQSINWDFGDGTTSTGLTSTHQFTTSGLKKIQAELTLINNTIVNIYKEVEVFPLPILRNNQALIQCDDDFDGISFFNLFNIREKITNPALSEEFVFYESDIDAQNDNNRISNPENYQNNIPNQEIFIKATNSNGCVSFSSFRIRANFVQVDPISDMYVCENSDQIAGNTQGSFDLIRKKIDVISELSLNRNTTLRFYNTYSDALTISNELEDNFISSTTTIWVRVENSSGCGGIQSFNAIVNSEPIINLEDNYTICFNPDIKPPVIVSADASNERFEWKNSSGNIISTAQNFTLTSTGNFSLTVYKTENGIICSNTKEFEVINPEKPTFLTIDVNTEDETNNIVEVSVSGNSNYEFSLDNTTFFGNGKNYRFTNVVAGLRTIYVRDVNTCEEPIQEKASVLGVPDFFTPNNDGKNDYWNIRGLDTQFFKSINIKIFNRLGNLIATITDFTTLGWDGTYDGKKMISNTYWYTAEIIDIDDVLIEKTGNFSLIRK